MLVRAAYPWYETIVMLVLPRSQQKGLTRQERLAMGIGKAHANMTLTVCNTITDRSLLFASHGALQGHHWQLAGGI